MPSPSTNPSREDPHDARPAPLERITTRLVQQVGRGEVTSESALQFMARDIRALTNADGAAIAAKTNDSEFVCKAAVGAAPDVGVVLRPDSGLSGECIRTARPMISTDTASDPRVDAGAAAALGVRSILVMPIIAQGVVVGLTEVFSATPNGFDARHVAALQRVAALLLRLLFPESIADTGPAPQALDEPGIQPPAAPPTAEYKPSVSKPGVRPALDEDGAEPFPDGVETLRLRILETQSTEAAPDRSWHRVAIIAGVLLLLLLVFLGWRSQTRPRAEPAINGPSGADVTSSEDPEALFARARQYETGEGVATDCARALEMFRRAAEAGHLLAQHELGLRYQRTDCGGADVAGSAAWFARAAQRGHPQAQREYASALAQGKGVPQDRVSAYAWYVLAQHGGDTASETAIKQLTKQMDDAEILRVRTRLGSMYAQGTGTARDYVKAYMWFTLAEKGGDESGKYLRESVGRVMSAGQIEKGRALAADWLRRHQGGMRSEEVPAEPAEAPPASPGGQRRARSWPNSEAEF